jgi:trans-aconitate methyltransferase
MEKDIRKIVEAGYDKGEYASIWRTSRIPNEMEKKWLDKLQNLIPSHARVLDLGCGPGIPFDSYLVDSGHIVTGIDISALHIEEAKKNVPTGTFIKGDFSEYQFDEKFNAIASFYAIFHIPREEHKALFEKMHNLLEPKGIILVTLGTSGTEGVEEKWLSSTQMAWSQYTPEEYKKIISEVGFKIIESDFEGKPGDDEYHFWLMAEKI